MNIPVISTHFFLMIFRLGAGLLKQSYDAGYRLELYGICYKHSMARVHVVTPKMSQPPDFDWICCNFQIYPGLRVVVDRQCFQTVSGCISAINVSEFNPRLLALRARRLGWIHRRLFGTLKQFLPDIHKNTNAILLRYVSQSTNLYKMIYESN